jgi:hypothetical protein
MVARSAAVTTKEQANHARSRAQKTTPAAGVSGSWFAVIGVGCFVCSALLPSAVVKAALRGFRGKRTKTSSFASKQRRVTEAPVYGAVYHEHAVGGDAAGPVGLEEDYLDDDDL